MTDQPVKNPKAQTGRTTIGRSAVNALVDMTWHQDESPVTLAAISRRVGISLSYLELIFGKLRQGGIVDGMRGPGGGYRLARPAAEISIADILFAVEDLLVAKPLGGMGARHDADLVHVAARVTHDLAAGLNRVVMEYLGSVSLQHLVDGANALAHRKRCQDRPMCRQ